MAELFHGKVLIRNNKDRDEVDTERELSLQLQNKVLLLFFGAADCPRCQAFAPKLKDFFVRLTDEFYVERASQLVLVYVSRDPTEDKQDKFLRDMPKRWLALPFEDHFKRDLEDMFKVSETPTVVVLRPDGSVISPNAVDEICDLGVACFKNWQEAADLIDRSFMLAEDFDELPMRSATEPLRRLRYKVDKKKSKVEDEEEDGGVWG
ncbi:nucleoredoxin-like protein 1 [Erpetoichthys calabaricus]|uniref:Nucleoredoxin like 1 n=1 Tax=Erpetoichthys calabaricus TaxID=27687 RepID=A0A8C4SX97_ERPCA|nr:nucleoredoxin-like protein 1 [Erpetoichthys calabaricus]